VRRQPSGSIAKSISRVESIFIDRDDIGMAVSVASFGFT
jgi:hypothetical protein